LKAFLFHLFLGFISTQFPWIACIYLYILIIQWFWSNNNKFSGNAILGIVQICGLEFWGRLTNMNPFFPYELSKYLMLVYFLFYLLFANKKTNKAALILFFIFFLYSVSAILGDMTYSRVFSDANALIILLLGAALFTNSNLTVSKEQLLLLINSWVNYLFLGLIFVIIKTPNIENMNLSLGANYDATGGESANQVSTYLGLGTFLIFFLIITKKYLSGYRTIDILLFVLFIFQSLLTFSRGGFVVSLFLVFLLLHNLNFISFNSKRILLVTLFSLLVIVTFKYLDSKTNGLLLNRFKGETSATLIGKKDKTLNVVTSNRLQIVEENWEIFGDNFFGVGSSRGTEKRKEMFGTNYYDHTEPSRWLVEYGIFGIILLVWFVSVLFKYLKFSFPDNASKPYSAFLVAMMLFSSLTMLHSATRTFVSFLPMVVGFIKLNPNVSTANRRNKSPQQA
jgi:hypothetical protein